jgi:outer membrane protein assembly factor BamB
VSWTAEDNIPDIGSPVSDGELVFTLTTPGMLTCFDAKDGKKQWEQDLAMDCQASPVVAGNKLYVFGSTGISVILEIGRAYRELRRNDLEEKIYASPAFMPGRIYVRGVAHLFCITGQQGALARGN